MELPFIGFSKEILDMLDGKEAKMVMGGSQFKKTSGMSPSSFKKLKKKGRKPLDQLTGK